MEAPWVLRWWYLSFHNGMVLKQEDGFLDSMHNHYEYFKSLDSSVCAIVIGLLTGGTSKVSAMFGYIKTDVM